MDRRVRLVDILLGVAAFAVSAVVVARAGAAPALREPDAVAYGLLAVYSASVVVRRSHPTAAVGVGLVAGLAYSAAAYPLALTPVVVLSIYSAGARLPETRSRTVLIGAVVLAAMAATLAPGPTSTGPPLIAAGAWFLGRYMRDRRRSTEALEAKNQALQQAQHDLARQAVTEERFRIARELHDVVAHSMSVVAVHAGSGRMVAAEDPAAAERALATMVGEAEDGEKAVALVRRLRPWVVLMDIRMPVLDGIKATRRVTRRLIEEFANRPEAGAPAPGPELAALSEREREVLAQVGRGLSNAGIAERLYVSPATAKTHVSHILTKLDARDRAQLVVMAYESGLVHPGM